MNSHSKHRHAVHSGGALPATDWCDYPGCVLKAWHEGDHDFEAKEPRYPVRVLQVLGFVGYDGPWCELNPTFHREPAHFYCVDGMGKAWMLCPVCMCHFLERPEDAEE